MIQQRRGGLLLLLGLLVSSIVQAQTVPVNSSLTLQGALQLSAPLMHCDANSGTDSYACNLAPAITAYVNDLCYSFTADVANTGTASINYNTIGPITITKVQGGITTVLADNDIRVGQVVHVCYDGTQMQMVSQLGNAPPGATYTFGAGVAESGGTVTTASSEADFLTSGALTCGAATQGKAQVHTTPLQYCDNAATPTLQYAAYGDSTGGATTLADGAIALGSLRLATPLMHCVANAGTDTYACNLSPAITAYTDGMCYGFTADVANTGAATINFNTLGDVALTRVIGGIATPLIDNDIRINQRVEACYDGTSMQVHSQLGNAGSTTQVTKTGTPVDNQVAVWTADGIIEGTTALQFGAGVLGVGDATGTGKLGLNGITSGTVTIQPQNEAGTYNFNLPVDAGSSGAALTSAGGGTSPMTWTPLGTMVTATSTFGSGGVVYSTGTTRATASSTGHTYNATAVLTETVSCPTITSGDSPYTLGAASCINADTTGGDIIVLTPAAASGLNARKYAVTKVAAGNTLTLDQTGADTHNGSANNSATTALWSGFAIREQSASNWYVEQAVQEVTYARIQDVSATDRVLCRDTAGAGDIEECTVTAPLAFTGGPGLTVSAATTSAAGVIELADATETTTGTATDRAVTPDGLAGSTFGRRYVTQQCVPDATALTIADGKCFFPFYADFVGWKVVEVWAGLGAVLSSSGAVSIGMDMCVATDTAVSCSGANRNLFTTNLTIDQGESRSETAATPAVINASNNTIGAKEWLMVNVDALGTSAQGLYITLVLQAP